MARAVRQFGEDCNLLKFNRVRLGVRLTSSSKYQKQSAFNLQNCLNFVVKHLRRNYCSLTCNLLDALRLRLLDLLAVNGNSSRMSSNMIAIWPTGKWFNVPFGWRIIDCVSWSDRQLNFGYFDILSQEWARRTSGTTKAWRHCAWTRLIRPIWPLPFSSTNRKFRFDTFDLASAALPHPTRLPLVPLPARQGHQVDSRKHCERKNVSGRIRKSGQRREDVKLLIMFFPFFVSLFFFSLPVEWKKLATRSIRWPDRCPRDCRAFLYECQPKHWDFYL